MRRFIGDLKRYYRYIFYSAKSILKQEVADSFLNWVWLILNPIMFMLVYSFVQIAIFGNETKYLASFLFIGLTCWNFFNPCITGSIRMIKRYQGIISKVYVPKYVFLLSNMLVNSFKTLISFGLVIISLIAYRIPFSPSAYPAFCCTPASSWTIWPTSSPSPCGCSSSSPASSITWRANSRAAWAM